MEHTSELILSIKAEKDKICFSVRDNGVGMTSDELSKLNNNLECEESSGDSIGLMNINQRLRLHFSKEHCLKISSSPGKGTIVSFSIPLGYGKSDG